MGAIAFSKVIVYLTLGLNNMVAPQPVFVTPVEQAVLINKTLKLALNQESIQSRVEARFGYAISLTSFLF